MAKTTLGQIGKTLEDLPRGPGAYKQAYEKTIVRIRGQPSEHQQLARRTLGWLACAAREITALELRHALVIRGNSSSLPSEEDLESTNFVIKVCMGLVIIEGKSGIIRLLHHTALEYLQQNLTCLWNLEDPGNAGTCLSPPKSSECAMQKIHQDITKICIKYLSFEATQRSLTHDIWSDHKNPDECPFLDYTLSQWNHHWRESCNETSLPVSMVQTTTAFLESNAMAAIIDTHSFAMFHRLKDIKMIHFVAFFGLTSMIDACIKNGHDIHATTRSGENALWFALEGRQEGTSKALLQRGAKEVFAESSNLVRLSSLGLAISKGMRVAADLLLDDNFGARINPETDVCTRYEGVFDRHRSDDFWPPLYMAAMHGNFNMTKMLLERGADPLAKYNLDCTLTDLYPKKDTALNVAARAGHKDIVECLLQADASTINAVDELYRTPFYWAVYMGNWYMANLLHRYGGNLFGAGTDSDPGPPTNVSLINGKPSSIRFWGRDGVPMDIGK